MPRASTLAVMSLLVLSASIRAADEGPVPAWRIHPSDYLHYARRPVTIAEDGKETLGSGARVTLYGHALRDGQYAPISPTLTDLIDIFALRLPASDEEESLRFLVTPRDCATVHVRGNLSWSKRSAEQAEWTATYTFATGAGERGDLWMVRSGRAEVHGTFDIANGRVATSRIVVTYQRRPTKWHDGKPDFVDGRTYVVEFEKRLAHRYPEFQKDVDTAIDRGVAYLRKKQIPPGQEFGGSYQPHGNHRIGSTALAVLTLAACDVERDDPAIGHALAWLITQTPKRTYDRALALMAFDRAFTPAEEWAADRRVERVRDLSAAQRAWCTSVAAKLGRSASSPGSWGYPAASRRSLLQFDSSNTQYAILGLRAAVRLGLDVDDSMWEGVVRHFRSVRERGGDKRVELRLVRDDEAVHDDGRHSVAATIVPEVGGFRYSTRDSHAEPWGSMTCAAIAGLAIARHRLERAGKLTGKLRRDIAEMGQGGWVWMQRNWAVDRHPGHPSGRWLYYYLYSLERAAVLTRVKRVGLRDWYFEGSVQLIARHEKDGAWGGRRGTRLSQTCFALLFLKRATAPLVTPR
jgi:hypothetical protein